MNDQYEENTLTIAGVGTNLRATLDEPISGVRHMIALQGFSTYYSWPNIRRNNNKLKYTINGAQKVITFEPGAYELDDLANYIKASLKNKGDDNAFELTGNVNTQKSVFRVIADGCVVNIGGSTIKSVLGWGLGNLGKGVHSSTKKVDINPVNEVLIHCNIAKGVYTSFDNKLEKQTVLASYYPNVPPGYKITFEPRQRDYFPSNTDYIQRVEVWLTDQDYNPIDNGKERLSVKLRVKSYK